MAGIDEYLYTAVLVQNRYNSCTCAITFALLCAITFALLHPHTGWCHYNAVNFLQNTSDRELKTPVKGMFSVSARSGIHSLLVTAVLYSILCYNCTRLYLCHMINHFVVHCFVHKPSHLHVTMVNLVPAYMHMYTTHIAVH